jgi:hypothetical protein
MYAVQGNPFAKLDKRTVTGILKATGSRDPDVLHAERNKLLSLPKIHKFMGIGLIAVGALMTLTIIGAVVGVPSVLAGWWLRRLAVRNLATIEAGYADYTGSAAAV